MIQEVSVSPLPVWESFYVIVGSSSAGLTGLMFVVITLIPRERLRAAGQTINAFATPNVVHFCAALLVSAMLSAPWRTMSYVGWLLGLIGIAGIVYDGIVVRRARGQTEYRPVLEDWVWHMILPFFAYLTLVVAAPILPRASTPALFAVAAATVVLLFIGIHNAWDTVTYVAFEERESPTRTQQAPAKSPGPDR
jgi:hypothetical protein